MKVMTVLLFFLITAIKSAAQSYKQPNIIFILIDDQRYDFLSFLDHPWIKTPNIDRLAEKGVFFDNAFVTTSLCSPSRASIMTGQYVHGHKVINNNTPLSQDIPTFAKELQKAGYNTSFIGKWHMGDNEDHPRPGYQHWVSFRGQGPYFDPLLNINGKHEQKKGYTTDILTDYAIDFIKNASKKNNPYFLYLSHKSIHAPFTPAPRHQGVYKNQQIPRPATFADTDENYKGKPHWLRRSRKSLVGIERDFSIHNWGSFENMFRLYSETMLAVDEGVGRIVGTLQSMGELDNTIIVYISDNGYFMGEHGLVDKRPMYEVSIRVPCFVHWPSGIKGPARRKELVLNIDIGPTILELAGCVVPSSMHGKSFARMIKGESIPWRKDFIYEYYADPWCIQVPTTIGLRTEKYSYITYEGIWDIYELYDIEKDPEQRNNLLGHINFGQTYGRFLDVVRQQDRQLWDKVVELDNRLTELYKESNGTRGKVW